MTGPGAGDRERAEALRRLLYRPGAGPGDVAAFVAAQPAVVEAPVAVASAPRRRVPARIVAPAVLVLTAAAGVIAWGLASAISVHSPAATPLPTATVDLAVRTGFVRALVEGQDAGLRAWLAPTGVQAQEDSGVGEATVQLAPPTQDHAGRMTVYLVLESDAEAGWTPARLAIDSNRTIYRVPGRTRSGTLLAGIPAVASTGYAAGDPPVRVIVQAPANVRWGLAAVFEQ